ncbi:hypothetical protein AAC387_Pa03g3090 [Persea americana]
MVRLLHSFLLLFLFSLLLHPAKSIIIHTKTSDYLKLRLLHRNPSPAPSQAIASDLHRLSALRAPIVSGASSGSGLYLVNVRVGTPPQSLLLIADTGSDLVWTRCSACRNCPRHRRPKTAFLPRYSSSFSPFHCYNRACRLVPPPPSAAACNITRLHSPCRYQYSYADQSTTSGFFSREIATLNASSGREIKLRNLAFGCGFHVSGPSLSDGHGVMGLGRGPISFSSQMGRRFGKNQFSYCLMDYTISPPPTSYLIIGGGPHQPLKRPMSFTPLQTNPLSPTFYYVQIRTVHVDGKPLRIDPSIWAIDSAGNGGTVIDSGTTLTFLAEPGYSRVLTAVRSRVRVPRVVGPAAAGFDLCVNVSGVRNPRLPRIGFGLLGGSVLDPPPRNYFIEADVGVTCLALQAVSTTGGGFSVIGNLMQQGFLFVFDRDGSRVGFSRTECMLS